jgi:cyanophycin synthetase
MGIQNRRYSFIIANFIPSAAQTPGRMNILNSKKFKVLIDFAHNASGYKGLKNIYKALMQLKKGIAGIGDVAMKTSKNVLV